MKAFLILSALLSAFALASCGDDDDSSGDDNDVSGDLTWQDTPSGDYMSWEEAITYCEDLGIDGYDDWRLPTISELRSLIRGCDGTVSGGSCGVTEGCLDSACWNGACGGCDYLEGPGEGGAYWPEGMTGEISWYWSSSPVADLGVNDAWGVYFRNGGVGNYTGHTNLARCVR